MIRGMAKLRNCPKIELKVTKILTIHSGQIAPAPIPAAIAMIILPRSPIFILFIVVNKVVTWLNGYVS
jgi:hypothetical protein